MAFKDGDFVEIEYSVLDAASSSVIETTDEKRARDAGIYHEHGRYGKRLVVLGFNRVIPGLDRELRSMAVSQEKKFTFKPEDAFGPRNDEYVRVMRLSDMRDRGIDPQPGMRVDLDGIAATVRSVNSGRVVVDANHPFAGREIVYEVKVVGNPVTDDEKVKALGSEYGVQPSGMRLANGSLTLDYDDKVKKDERYFVDKSGLVNSVFETMKGVSAITVEEHYRRDEKKADKPKQEVE